MGLFTFIKEAGEKLFRSDQPSGTAAASAPAAAPKAVPGPAEVAALNEKAGQAILDYIRKQNLATETLLVRYDGATSTVTVSGQVPDQATREKIILCCGNVGSVEQVNDQMTVTTPAEEAQFYVVKRGDTLSAIARQVYGDANKYHAIFAANQPMLTDPDKIYPGQSLRIPRAA